MDQFTFETIIKCIKVGAPVFADELVAKFIKLVESEATLKKQLELLSSPCEDTKKGG